MATDGSANPMEQPGGLDLFSMLHTLAANRRWLSAPLAIRIAVSAAERLHAAHTRCDAAGRPLHIVHGCVAPSLVLVGPDGSVQLARAPEEYEEPEYESPEQANGEPPSVRGDVFSLGLVLYELLTGLRPFAAESAGAARAAARACAIEPPSTVADTPAAFDPVVMKALAKVPAERYPDAGAFQHALERLLTENRLSATPAEVGKTVRELAALAWSGKDPERAALAEEILRTAAELEKLFGAKDAISLPSTEALREIGSRPEKRARLVIEPSFAADSEVLKEAGTPKAIAIISQLLDLGFSRLGIKWERDLSSGRNTPEVAFAAASREAFAGVFFLYDVDPMLYFITPFADGRVVLTGCYERRPKRSDWAVLTGVDGRSIPEVLEAHLKEVRAMKAKGHSPISGWGRAERLESTRAYYANPDI